MEATSPQHGEFSIPALMANMFKILMRHLPDYPRQTVQLGHFDNVIQRVMEKTQDVTVAYSDASKNKKRLEKFYKVMIRELVMEFGSVERLVNAAIICNITFEDSFIRNLKIHREIFLESPPKKSLLCRIWQELITPSPYFKL